MAFRYGKDCKVTLGADSIVGMGTYSLDGVDTELLETTEFGDNWKTFANGLKDGGTISFSGLLDADDTTGQDALRTANELGSSITSIRFYIDNTSYYEPNQTGTPSSYVNVTAWNITASKNALMEASFTVKVSGKMTLV